MSERDGKFGRGAKALFVVIVGLALITLVVGIYAVSREPPPPARGSTPVPAQAAAAQGGS